MQPFLNFVQHLRESATATLPDLGRVSESTQRDGTLAERGYRAVQASNDPSYQRTFSEAQRLYDRAMSGDRWAVLTIQEAMTRSDFSVYLQDIFDRQFLANYAEAPYTWSMYAKRNTIASFNLQKIYRTDHGGSVLDGPIVQNATTGSSGSGPTGLKEVSEYPQSYRTLTNYTDQLYKFGRRMDWSWELSLSDDIGLIADTPRVFGLAARRTEERRATALFVTSTGPNGTFFSTANGNVINNTVIPGYSGSPNPPFSLQALQDAITVLLLQKDLDGEPIYMAEDLTLVYPPQLNAAVKQALNATSVFVNSKGGSTVTFGTDGITSDYRLQTANWVSAIVRNAALNQYLPVIDTTHGATAWYLFANPNSARPAIQLSFLRSAPGPQIFQKAPDQILVGGGGGVASGEGSFDTDAIEYKVRHVIGGTLLDPMAAVASNGSGS